MPFIQTDAPTGPGGAQGAGKDSTGAARGNTVTTRQDFGPGGPGGASNAGKDTRAGQASSPTPTTAQDFGPGGPGGMVGAGADSTAGKRGLAGLTRAGSPEAVPTIVSR